MPVGENVKRKDRLYDRFVTPPPSRRPARPPLRALVVSDLHFEFHADGGRSFVADLRDDVDVVLLAGDLTDSSGLTDALDVVARRFRCPVVYVHGNHELYGSNRDAVVAATARAAKEHANLSWLDKTVAVVAGRRILGAPLWFRETPGAPTWAMNDFAQIDGFASWVYEENARALRFFERELREGDVVVTHHLPAEASVHARFAGSPLNAFFVCDVRPLIEERRPALWVHGHSHESSDYVIGPTRVVCNPFGYARNEENPRFDFGKVIEIP